MELKVRTLLTQKGSDFNGISKEAKVAFGSRREQYHERAYSWQHLVCQCHQQ